MNTYPGILGRKIGTTQIFDEKGEVLRCSVVQGGAVVVGKRTKEKNGYDALIVGLGERKEKHTSKPMAGPFKKAGQTPKRVVRELRGAADWVAKFEVGQTLLLNVGPDARIELRCGGVGLLGGRMGRIGHQVAVKVENQIRGRKGSGEVRS